MRHYGVSTHPFTSKSSNSPIHQPTHSPTHQLLHPLLHPSLCAHTSSIASAVLGDFLAQPTTQYTRGANLRLPSRPDVRMRESLIRL